MKRLMQMYFVLCFLLLLSFSFHVDSTLSTLSFNSSAPTQLCPRHQSLALIQFNNSLSIDCSASEFWCHKYKKKTISWKEGTSCCMWDGVKCESETGNVIGLDLSCSCLRGTILSNSTLFLLHHLQDLNLAYNDFSSSQLSFKFGQFTTLTHLNISGSGFTGIIPLQISHLSKLISLDLSDIPNNLIFEGHVFDKVLENLTQLQHLLLDQVNMSSVAPTSFLNMSSSIRTLTLWYSGLQGKFPVDVFRFPCLQKLILTANDMDINFPKVNWSSPLRSLEVSSLIYSSLGELPDSIGNLRSLEVLDLSSSNLKGSIPATLVNLSRLNHLDLSRNLIHGPIFFPFSNFKQLSYLDFSNNYLVGPIIDSFGNLTHLLHLSTGNNSLTGHLPFSTFNLTQIESLDFSYNEFVGPLPNQVSGLSRLPELRLNFNFLSGKVPSWLFSLSSSVELRLSDNNLTGPIEQADKIGPLERVYLQNNEIHGPIPNFSTLVNLTYLDLSSNKLNGIFQLDKSLNQLNELHLSNNVFISLTSGSNVNASLPSLQSLGLSSCNIMEVPDVVRNLPGLTTLDLSYNRICVIEAQMFMNLERLESLDLSHNSALSVSNNSNVPLVLPSLIELKLSYGNITQFPNFLTTLDSLTHLDLSYNRILVIEAHMFLNLGSLEILDLSHNNALSVTNNSNVTLVLPNLIELKLSCGNITQFPNFLTTQDSLIHLDLSSNKMIGEIPSSICHFESMQVLDLSNNSLSGAIPECLNPAVMKQLDVLDLHMNQFHGNIPHICPEGNSLSTLNLNSNAFDGPLPKSLVKCQDLVVLNLGNNKINDTFPHWLGSLPQLKVLVLRANYFHGQIIQSANESQFSTLQILDLSHNEFSGFLPTPYFKSFEGMTNLSDVEMGYLGDDYYQDSVVITMKGVDITLEKILTIFTTIDMSSNKFEGEIPKIVGTLFALQVLNFSHNKLTGHIPSSFGNLTALESLDLSFNKLGGEIPMQLVGLNFLEVLNLSQNQLVGLIPGGKQFNTFPNDSYGGNLGLCGFPLSKRCGPDEPLKPVFRGETDSTIGLDWNFVMMGYGCGLVCGFSAGYIMLTLQKPKWLVKRVQRLGNKVMRRLRRYG
ncbi:hypothetical protein PTKIN_Ptkin14bG0175700 [Pterospermum kingtungense]